MHQQFSSIGYGAGAREGAKLPNLLRVLVGRVSREGEVDEITVLETNLDDISGELIGHTTVLLFEAGALDVYTTPIHMKKNRPGVMLSTICRPADVDALEEIIFRETTTLGLRRWQVSRRTLKREAHQVNTQWGPVDAKLSITPAGAVRFAPEYESCRQVAIENNVPLGEVYEAARSAYRQKSE